MDIRKGELESDTVQNIIRIDKQKMLKLVFYLYLLFVFFVVAIKFTGNNLDVIINRWDIISSAKEAGERNINLVPFATISNYMRQFSQPYAYMNIVGNLIVFIPFGFLFPMVYPNRKSFFSVFVTCFVTVVGIELFQYTTCLGFCDIDDLILNMLGCVVGYVIYTMTFHKKEDR